MHKATKAWHRQGTQTNEHRQSTVSRRQLTDQAPGTIEKASNESRRRNVRECFKKRTAAPTAYKDSRIHTHDRACASHPLKGLIQGVAATTIRNHNLKSTQQTRRHGHDNSLNDAYPEQRYTNSAALY